ncbi:MAG: flavodoxin family protein [Bacteroidia bacterium]
MKNYIILYYSKTNNSKFIAEKLSFELACKSKKITPIIDNVFLIFLLSMLKINIPTNISTKDLKQFDEVIIIGPIWGGQLISPLRTVLKKCVKASKNTHFALTCETKEEDKDSKYGYAQVIKQAIDFSNEYIKNVAAFSTSLINLDNKLQSLKITEKIKLTEENYNDDLKTRVKNFAIKITGIL